MKFGVNTFIWSDHFDNSHAGLLAEIKGAGFDGIEIPLIDPNQVRAAGVRQTLECNGLECTFCAVLPPGLNTISDDAKIRKDTVTHYKVCIETAAEMGGKLIAGPLYAPVGYLPGRRRTVDEWKWAVECFQQLGQQLERSNVTLALEPLNRYETYFLNTVADAVTLCREVAHPQVGILFDTYHANIEEKSVSEALLEAGPHLRHFHSCENDRGIPGSGHIDWPSVFSALAQTRYDGWLTIESFGFSMGAVSAAA
ncbi:MAG TPA: sugar phosphate isomerase/epimerase, partial [Bryobacteraceae bacterium]|nr:sugar phosphate isomerase/epimerase [Bryobacteraceae bacterium]